jgi:hypothetical protein
MATYRWLDERSHLTYNREGKHKNLATAGEKVQTGKLVSEETMERYAREGKAERL